MGVSMNPDPDAARSASCSISSSSSIGSVFTGVEGPGEGPGEAGVGVISPLQLPQKLRQLPWSHFLTHMLEQCPALSHHPVSSSHRTNG